MLFGLDCKCPGAESAQWNVLFRNSCSVGNNQTLNLTPCMKDV